MNIGFFDSGLGGLLVLKAVAKELPQYDYIYYGDTAHLPYGDKSEEEIFAYTRAAIEELFARDCALVVVACNTASAETLRKLQDTYLKEEHPDKRILGVIVPTVEVVAAQKPEGVFLIATTRTVASKKYECELSKLDSSISLHSVATPKLVPLIESHQRDVAAATVIEIVETNTREGDVVILGCTHYSVLKKALRSHFGTTRTIISQDEIIPAKLADYLLRHTEIREKITNTGKREIVLTEHREDYHRLVAEFLGGVYLAEDTTQSP